MTSPAPLQYIPRSLKTAASVAHLEYDPLCIPDVPSSSWTRFVCISDNHTRTFNVPDGDVLLHSGDLTNLGLETEFEEVIEWLCGLPHKIKIIIAGNHDLPLHDGWYEGAYNRWHRNIGKQDRTKIISLFTSPRAQEAGIIYLQDASHTFQAKAGGRTWTVYGSPWSPYFHDWAFNYQREQAEALISEIPATDILLTHAPPSRLLDLTRSSHFAGCEALRMRLPKLRPRLHVFGHIHEARGGHIHAWGQGEGVMPEVNIDEDSDDSDSDLDEEYDARAQHKEEQVLLPNVTQPLISKEETDETMAAPQAETVFVNASTFPMGRGEWRAGERVPFGGPGFQPVIVDLRDSLATSLT